MSSKRFDGVLFQCFSDDHEPAHVHGAYAGVLVTIELRNGRVTLAKRKNRVVPRNSKKSDVKKVLQAARDNAEALVALWRQVHG